MKKKMKTKQKRITIDDLPELPLEALELAGKLEQARTAPVLTIRPKKQKEPVRPRPVAAAPRSQHCVRTYMAFVTYPVVVCYPIDVVPPAVALAPAPAESDVHDIEATARRELYYKLTHHRGAKLRTPSFCTVKHGPWSALVTETESCDGAPNTWTLFLGGTPEPVQLVWFGVWEDVPAFPNLHVVLGTLTMVGQKCSCCPGYYRCPATGSCIPNRTKCGEFTPA